jgi:dienelactone hydrolase
MLRRLPLLLAALGMACTGDALDDTAVDDTAADAPLEPLDLPADPAEGGTPVGFQTFDQAGIPFSVWYPATESTRGQNGVPIDYNQFVPDVVVDAVGDLALPEVAHTAIQNATVRNVGEALPVVVFSHGMGGSRFQSLDYVTHLASRGYIVVASDHPGRMMADLLPCVFSPVLEGCDLGGFSSDVAVEQLPGVLDALDEMADDGQFAAILDMDRLGLSGHSAGGGTTGRFGDAEPRFDALLSMAAGAQPTRDVPTLLMDATCDGVVLTESVDEAYAELVNGERVRILGAGHLAFSEMCELELGRLAEELLDGRDDINTAILAQLVALGIDGCPDQIPSVERDECADEWLPLETSIPPIRHMSTVFFDQHLKGQGEGVQAGVFEGVEVE